MQFKREMADLVMAGKKTATRRLKKPRFKVGSLQPVQNGYAKGSHPLGYIRIDAIYEERLCDMVHADAVREGFETWQRFIDYLGKVNKRIIGTYTMVWVIEFHLEETPCLTS